MHTAETPRYKTYSARRALRLVGFDYRASRAYHVTWGTYQRRRLLASELLTRRIARILEQEAARARMILYAYCLMPDHIHLLVQPEANTNLISFVQGFKSKTTRAYWRSGGAGKLWQRGFYDHILRRTEDIQQTTRYILANPVRAGLADDVTRYTFSGSLVFDTKDL